MSWLSLFGLLTTVQATLLLGSFVNPPPADFRLSWTIDTDAAVITFKAQADIRGWIGIGWSPTKSDHNTPMMDFYAGYLDSVQNKFVVVDGNLQSHTDIRIDSQSDVINNASFPSYGERLGGTTTIQFSRALDTKDASDTPIVDQPYYLLWAYHPDDASFLTKDKHDYYGTARLNFFSNVVINPGQNMGPARSQNVAVGIVSIVLTDSTDYPTAKVFFDRLLTAAGVTSWRAIIFDLSEVLQNVTATPLVAAATDITEARGIFLTIFTLPNFRHDPAETKTVMELAAAIRDAVDSLPRGVNLASEGRIPETGNSTQLLLTSCQNDQGQDIMWPGPPCPISTAGAGRFVSPDKDFSITWNVIGGQPVGAGVIYFNMKADTTGWLGVCISQKQNHHRDGSVDCYVGWMEGGTLVFKDLTAHDHNSVPSTDPASSILQPIEGSIANGETTIKWSRKLTATPDDADLASGAAEYNMLWAHHPKVSDFAAIVTHEHFGVTRVDFTSGQLSELPWFEHMALGWGITDVDAGILCSGFVGASFLIVALLRHTKKCFKRICRRDLRDHRRFDSTHKQRQTEMMEVREAYGEHASTSAPKDQYYPGQDAFADINKIAAQGMGDEGDAPTTFEDKIGKKNSPWRAFLQSMFQLRLVGTHTPYEILVCTLYVTMNFFCILVSTVDLAANVGYLAAANSLMIILPANRNSLLVTVLAIPFDKVVFYHRMLAYWLTMLLSIHGLLYFPRWMSNDTFGGAVAYSWGDPKVFWGNMGGFTCAAILLTSLPWIRRRKYEAFYYLHFLFFFYYACAALHSPKQTSWYVIVAAGLWTIDRAVRFFTGLIPQQTKSMVVKPGGITAIRFNKNSIQECIGAYKVGQYVFVNLPAVSKFQWHPFSITSGPLDDFVEIHVRGLGDFTNNVLAMATGGVNQTSIRVDGPYGNPHPVTHLRFPILIFVAGGIGIAPIISYIRDIYDGTRAHCIRSVYVIWSVPIAANVGWFSYVFQEYLERVKTNRSLPSFEVRVFVTKEAEARNVKDAGFTTMPGYPDFNMLLNLCLKGEQKKAATMMFCCGPESLVNDAWDASNRLRREGFSIDFKHEVFEW